MEIIDYNINYCSESIFACILFILFSLSTIKNKKEIVNDIINLDIPLNYNLDSKRYTYEFEISQEDANQIENKKEEFDKKKKEIKDNGNIKFVD